MIEAIAYQPVEIVVEGKAARLVFLDGKLAGVVVQLPDDFAGWAGKWYAEAGFGPLERMKDRMFDDLNSLTAWIQALDPT